MIWNSRLLLIALVEWILVAEIESENYTRNYDGYVFTSPGLSVYRNKDEAQRLCKSNGSNLLEIKSSYDENLTFRFLNDIGVQFPNETLLLTNGIRNDGDWNWVNGQSIHSITVAGQEQGLAYSFGYINFNPSYLYIAASTPIESRGYICQGKFDCKNGFRRNEVCYKSYSSPVLSWFDARNRCLNEGGDLASFDFINDNQGLNSTLNGPWLNPPGTYWIGIRRQWWTWQTSNLEVRYSNWLNGRPVYVPDSRCLCLLKNSAGWKWIECNCTYVYPFVCLIGTTTQVTTIVTATSNDKISSAFTNITATQTNPYTRQPFTSIASTFSSARDANKEAVNIGVGVGVGIGGGLIIAAIIIVVFIFIRKRGCQRKPPVSNPPDVTLCPMESHYVEIPKQPGNESSTTSYDSKHQLTPPPPVYADLDILTESSSSMERDSVFLINAKTATLAPPNAHKQTTHVTVDGQQYAEVKRY